MVSIGVCQTSVRLSAAVWSFLVEFDCWFGESPTDSPAGKSRAARRTRSYGFYRQVLRLNTCTVGASSRTLDGLAFVSLKLYSRLRI